MGLTPALRIRAALLITNVMFWGCSSEEPAFQEHRVAKPVLKSADANGNLNPENDNNPIWNEDGTLGGSDSGAQGGPGSTGDNGPDGGMDGGTDAGIDGGSGLDSGTDGGLDGLTGMDGGTDGGSTTGTDGGTHGGTDGGTDGGMDGGATDSGNEPGPEYSLVNQEYTQKSPGQVDILWVIDSSGSMSEEQQYLGDNFNSFITELNTSGHDVQLAVTTTDVCADTEPPQLKDRKCPTNYGGSTSTRLRGSFVGAQGSQVLNAQDSDVVEKFNQYTSVGTTGSGFEHGLTGAKMAVDKVLSGANDNLLRAEAHLAVIVVSDEEDDGIGLWKTDGYNGNNFGDQGLTEYKYTEDDFIADMMAVKGSKFTVSTITGTATNGTLCSAPHSQPREEGTQYIKAAEKTGGIVQSICDTDWSKSLSEIGLDLNAQATQIALDKTPWESTLRVWVDNQLTDKWTYSKGTNVVKFNNDAVPEPGQVVKVQYYGK